MILNKVLVRITAPKFERSTNHVLLLCNHLEAYPGFRHALKLPLPYVHIMPLFSFLSLTCVAGGLSFLTLHSLSSELEEHWFSSSFYDYLLAFSPFFCSSTMLFSFMSATAESKLLYSIQNAQEKIAK